MWIEVPILCNTPNSANLADLGIDSADLDERIGSIKTEHIFGYYPTHNREHVIVHTWSESIEVCLDYEDFKKLILAQ